MVGLVDANCNFSYFRIIGVSFPNIPLMGVGITYFNISSSCSPSGSVCHSKARLFQNEMRKTFLIFRGGLRGELSQLYIATISRTFGRNRQSKNMIFNIVFFISITSIFISRNHPLCLRYNGLVVAIPKKAKSYRQQIAVF